MRSEARRTPPEADKGPAAPSDEARIASAAVEGDPRAARTARQFLRRELADWQVESDLVDVAVLCLSELVANAVTHAGTASDLRVVLDGPTLTLVVRDHGGADEVAADADRDPLRSRGRGLQVVDALAHRWGADRDESGTTVWVELDRGAAC